MSFKVKQGQESSGSDALYRCFVKVHAEKSLRAITAPRPTNQDVSPSIWSEFARLWIQELDRKTYHQKVSQ